MFDSDDARETKNLCDYVLDDIEQNDIFFKYEPVGNTLNYPSPPEPLPTFSDILLPKSKNRGKLAKKFFKKYQKLRWNREMVKKAEKRALQEGEIYTN